MEDAELDFDEKPDASAHAGPKKKSGGGAMMIVIVLVILALLVLFMPDAWLRPLLRYFR